MGFFSFVMNLIGCCISVDDGWKNSSIGRDRDICWGKEIKVYGFYNWKRNGDLLKYIPDNIYQDFVFVLKQFDVFDFDQE